MIPEKKICAMCNIEKESKEFPLRKKPKGYVWLRAQCYECMKVIYRERYNNNKEIIIERNSKYAQKNKEEKKNYLSKYRKENKDILSEKSKKKYEKNKEELGKARRGRYKENPTPYIESVREYSKNNRDKINKRVRDSVAKRKSDDIGFKLKVMLAGRIRVAIKNKGKKCKRTMELVGCTIPFMIEYIEKKFKEGMSWSNYGRYGWHLDHIKPLSKFDLSKPEQQLIAFHYTNIQPLWAYENLEKSDKIDEKYGNT